MTAVASATARASVVRASTRYRVTRDPVVWAFVGVALLVQVAYLLAVDAPLGIGDQVDYASAGHEFSKWWMTPNAGMQRMPGYPLLLSIAYYQLGVGDGGVQILQALALALVTLAVAFLAADAGGRAAGRVAAGLYAVYFPLLSFSTVLLTEAATIALALAGTACAVRAIRCGAAAWHRWVIPAAGLVAYGCVVRSDATLFAAVLTVALVAAAPDWRRRISALLIVVLALALVFGPWIGRNKALTGELQPFGTTGRYPAALGVHLPFDRDVGEYSTMRRSVRFWGAQRSDGFGPREAEELDMRQELWNGVTKHPGEFLVTRAIGQAQLWVWPVDTSITYGTRDDVPYRPFMALHLLVLLAALVSFVRLRGRLVVRIAAGVTVLVAGLHLVTFPQPRYALPVIPLLMAAAAPTLVLAWQRARTVATRRSRAGDAAGAPVSASPITPV